MKMWNQTFRSDGRGVDKTDDMEQIIIYAKRGPEADRIKRAVKRQALLAPETEWACEGCGKTVLLGDTYIESETLKIMCEDCHK